MREKLRQILYSLIIKILHPNLKTNGLHMIRPGTTIIIKSGGNIRVGKNCKTKKRDTLASVEGTLTIGNNVFFNQNNIIVCHNEINIGDYCLFGPNVVIYDHDHKFGLNGIAVNEFNSAPIIIDNNCWIGANVTILRGTHIGEGSVIGAGSIIKGKIPPHSLVKTNRELIIKQLGDME